MINHDIPKSKYLALHDNTIMATVDNTGTTLSKKIEITYAYDSM